MSQGSKPHPERRLPLKGVPAANELAEFERKSTAAEPNAEEAASTSGAEALTPDERYGWSTQHHICHEGWICEEHPGRNADIGCALLPEAEQPFLNGEEPAGQSGEA